MSVQTVEGQFIMVQDGDIIVTIVMRAGGMKSFWSLILNLVYGKK